MLFLCFYYCADLAKFLYYASSAMMVVMALFMLKRGVYFRRRGLRQAAFILMFIAAFKTLVIDLRMEQRYLLCAKGLPFLPCSRAGAAMMDVAALALFLLASVGLFYLYRAWMPEKNLEPATPEDVRLRFWANLGMFGVMAMIVWLAAPWVGFLTVGYLPAVFTYVTWKTFALCNLALILYGFWKAENVLWTPQGRGKSAATRHLHNSWTPRDTQWMTVFLYLIALALSYVSHDVLDGQG